MSKDKVAAPVKDQPIKLQHPFKTAAGVPVEQVHVKSITVRQMKNAQRGAEDDADVEIAYIAAACDLVVDDLDDMRMIDFMTVRERFQQVNCSSSKG